MTRTYERIAIQMLAGQKQRPAKIARFIDKKLRIGTASLHRTKISRQWRTFWRLKLQRM